MKFIKLITLTLLLLPIQSCKKDKEESPGPAKPRTFAEINQNHIKEKESLMSESTIQASGANNGVTWKMGDVYVYRTRSGLFGKFRVGTIEPDINYRLTISAVTYKHDGSVHNEMEKLVIRGTYGANLEDMTEAASIQDMDFQWVRQNQATTIFTPANSAAFIVYRLE